MKTCQTALTAALLVLVTATAGYSAEKGEWIQLFNGKEFDSSYSRNEPAEFPVQKVISGWTEALQKMKVGGKWILYVPGKLAYGPRGSGPDIGPNATLIFEIELLAIVK